jgi:hypothetical protein
MTIYAVDLPYDLEDTLDQAFSDMAVLSDYEIEFIEDVQDMYDQYGEAMIVTERQIEILDQIREKIY